MRLFIFFTAAVILTYTSAAQARYLPNEHMLELCYQQPQWMGSPYCQEQLLLQTQRNSRLMCARLGLNFQECAALQSNNYRRPLHGEQLHPDHYPTYIYDAPIYGIYGKDRFSSIPMAPMNNDPRYFMHKQQYSMPLGTYGQTYPLGSGASFQ